MENILEETGQCGKFQVSLMILVHLCRFSSAFAFSLMIFGLYNPGWRCAQNNFTLLDTDATGKSPYGAFEHGNDSFSEITLQSSLRITYTPPEHFSGATPSPSGVSDQTQNGSYSSMKINESVAPVHYNGTCNVVQSCSVVEFNPASSTIVTEFGLICDGVWIAYLILSVLNGGMLVGALVWGQFGERFGRRACLYSSTFVMTVASGLAVFSSMWELYAFFTFFLGFGIVSIMPTTYALNMEFLNSKWRGRLLSVPVWNIGICCFALVTYILREWRYIHLACAFLCGVACLGFFWTPESLRWLVIHGKTSEANRVVRKMSRLNQKPCPSLALNELLNSKENEDSGRHYNYLDLFRNRDIRSFAIKLGLVRITSVISHDVIGFGIKSLPGDFYTNVILTSVIDVPFVLALSPMVNRLGRRPSGLLLMSFAAVCCLIILVSLLASEAGNEGGLHVTILALTTKAAMTAFVSFITMYTIELVPTAVRSLAFGYLNVLSRLTGMLVPFLIPRDYQSMIIAFAVLTASQVTACGILFSMPETKNKAMKDTLQDGTRQTDEN